MSVAQQTSEEVQKNGPRLRNGRWAGYWHLLASRMKEMKREPEIDVLGVRISAAAGARVGDRFPQQARRCQLDCSGWT